MRLPLKPFSQPRDCNLSRLHRVLPNRIVAVKVAAPERESTEADGLEVDIDNKSKRNATILRLKGLDKPGLLAALTSALQTLDIKVEKVNFIAKQLSNSKLGHLQLRSFQATHGFLPYSCVARQFQISSQLIRQWVWSFKCHVDVRTRLLSAALHRSA